MTGTPHPPVTEPGKVDVPSPMSVGGDHLPRLTDARRRALAVLMTGERSGRPVLESNYTTVPRFADSAPRLAVYWQSVNWLVREHLAFRAGHERRVRLTQAGRTLAAEAGVR